MPQSLREAMTAYLEDWHKDIPAAWQNVLKGVEPNIEAIPDHLTKEDDETIIPLHRGHNDQRAPEGSHLLKALDGVTPEAVRVVLLGQDPYPNIHQATGRSFEQGDLVNWNGKPKVSPSLQRTVQVLAAHRQPNHGFAADDSAWPQWLSAFAQNNPVMQTPAGLFDHWSQQGVLCLNLGLTLSRFDKDKRHRPRRPPAQAAHMALWTPVVRAILSHLVCRQEAPLVLMEWGDKAQRAVDAMNLPALVGTPPGAGGLLRAPHCHPNALPKQGGGPPAFFVEPNPFTQANALLPADKSEPPINL